MNRFIQKAIVIPILLITISGCSFPRQNKNTPSSEPTVVPSPTPNVEATVNSAVMATSAAKEGLQATIESAIAGTETAKPPKPTPTLINVTTVTEEEVAAMVEKEVEEAMVASTSCATTSTTAVADDTLTSEELAAIEAAIYSSDVAIAEATELAEQYLALYSEMSVETITLLNELENDLVAMSQSTAQIATTLDEINTALQQGLELTEDTINQLETQAAQIQTQVTEVQTKVSGWKEQVNTELKTREDMIGNIQADTISTDRAVAIQQFNEYITLAKSALTDGKLSLDELTRISKAGANASASLSQFGEIGVTLSEKINGVTRNMARGELPQAMTGLKGMENNSNTLGDSLKGFTPPSLPKPPSRR